MAEKNHQTHIILWISVLILVSLGCGSLQIGVVTPAPTEGSELASENQASELEEAANHTETSQPQEQPVPVITEEPSEPANVVTVTAWLGHITSLPQGSQYDDMVVLSPEGTGEIGLSGATPAIEAEIRSLRDAEGPNQYIYLWGTLYCNVEDYNNCQLVVDKMQYGANYSEENIQNWQGTIKSHTFSVNWSWIKSTVKGTSKSKPTAGSARLSDRPSTAPTATFSNWLGMCRCGIASMPARILRCKQRLKIYAIQARW